ncbi:MAG: SOS response-associated peptidase [Planctomycetes bacterium]|nr:SOS response-associated peptidase [Planctomycetota bacterium]
MCGRFTLQAPADVLADLFGVPALYELPARYNIAPTQDVAAVRIDPDEGDRELVMLRWGLVPFFAKDPSIGNRMINARGETLAEKPSFRAAYRSRRCLIPADGFYEWQKLADGKQPQHVAFVDGSVFAMAGLYENWRRPDGGNLSSCTIITTEASEDLAWLHDRMPVILDPEDWELWLDPELKDRSVLDPLLVPWAGRKLRARPVSRRVNSPREDDPDLLDESA